ncbi:MULTISPECIES: MFS transporter [unclassified Acinetobacter]|uniref:MFS transporter n=1 Tax=unclassified Acinetobacter TaxID=196816 RepID=UPI001203AA55|nr:MULTISPECIES: MFS transporter [unclassified Acinetobacter]RZJ24082.1 MAG: MFS transporter [Acinetobacter sp.]
MEKVQARKSLIKEVIDQKISSYQWMVILLCFTIALFDGFDTQAIAFTAPALLAHFNLQPGALAPILTAGIVGMTVGAMLLGLLGDKLGRRKTLLFCTAIFSTATLFTAFVSNIEQIFILRVIAGLGMGGATPVLLALAAEYSPQRFKGTVTTGVLLALPAGAMFGGLLAAKMLPLVGWQGIYMIGGALPLVLLIVLYFVLPESLEYMAQKNSASNIAAIQKILNKISPKTVSFTQADLITANPTDQNKAKLSILFQNGLARTTAGVWGTYFFNWIAWFMLLSWLPTILKQAGLAPEQAPYASVTVNAAFIVFAIPLAYWLPKLNTAKILTFMLFTGLAVVIGLGLLIETQQWGYIFALIALAGFGIGGQQLALNYLVVAAYPTQVRATATGWAIGMGRMGAIIGSAIGGIILTGYGVSGYFYALGIPLIIALCCVFLIKYQAPLQKGQTDFAEIPH